MAALAIAAMTTLLCGAGLSGDVFAGFRRQASDALFPSEQVDSRVVVVGVDARSILETATPWPWPRSVQARLVDELTRAGAELVVIDVLYHPAGAGDAELADALKRAPGAVLAVAAELAGEGSLPLLRASSMTAPVDQLAAASKLGHVNITPDSADAVVRALPLAIEGPDSSIVPSLALVALAQSEQLSGQIILRRGGVQLGGRVIPTDRLGRLEVNYAAGLRSGEGTSHFRSAADVLAGRLAPGELNGKVVLIGATDPALGDSHVTPVDKGGRMPGVFIHANALNTLLTRSYLVPASSARNLMWVLALALVAAAATLLLPLWAAVPATIAAVAVHLGVGIARFADGIVVDLLYPTIAAGMAFVAALGLRYVTEARERRRICEVLSQYVPPSVARQMIDRGAPGGDLPSGTITFLFTDVVGSTATWEASPKEMSRAMRLHDAIVEAAVQGGGGALVRPRGEGDSRFAVFVSPSSAAGAAADIVRSLADERWPTPKPIRVRIALHTGEAQLWEGDYYGSPPNRCARIRSAAEPGQVLLSSTTAAAIATEVPEGTTLRPLGPVALKDFEDPEEISELVVADRPGFMARWEPALLEPEAD